jgi:glycosyltransferase involved in cell wall biosynthesis
MVNKRDITICSYFKSEAVPPRELTLFDGDSSLGGFFRALKAALLERDYDVIHAHSPYTGLFLLMALVRHRRYRTLIPSTVYTVQDSYLDYRLSNRLMLIPIFACFRKLIFCSHAAAASMPFFLKWFASNKSDVVQNAVDIDRVDRTTRNKRDRSPHFTIATVGRLTKIKNLACLLMAFEQSNDRASQLVIIGEGHLRPRLTARTQELGLERRVTLAGLVPRDQVFEHLTRADVFVSVSRGEGLPVAVLEAMACRRPVILSDIPPHREIADGVNFINLIQPDDVAGFAQEIRRFREMSYAERAEIGEKCRKLVEDRFSLATMHKACDTIYNQIQDVR